MNEANKFMNDFIEYTSQQSEIYTLYRDGKRQKFLLKDDDIWKLAYDESHPIRCSFPKYWIVNQRGDIISMYRSDPYWLRRDNKEPGNPYEYYHYRYEIEPGTTVQINIGVHALLAIVNNNPLYGKVKYLMDKYGAQCFGLLGSGKVQGHHKDTNPWNNAIINIQLLTESAHTTLHNLSPVGDLESCILLSRTAAVEEPELITLAIVGDEYRELIALDEDLDFGNGFKIVRGQDGIYRPNIPTICYTVENKTGTNLSPEMRKGITKAILQTEPLM